MSLFSLSLNAFAKSDVVYDKYSYDSYEDQCIAVDGTNLCKSDSDISISDLKSMSEFELAKAAGKQSLRVITACSVSSWTIALAAIGETIPMYSALTTSGAEVYTSSLDQNRNFYSNSYSFTEGNSVLKYVAGVPLSQVGRVFELAYDKLFKEEHEVQDKKYFLQSKDMYSATSALATHFYSEEGNCGAAGKALVDILQEGSSR